MPETDAHPAHAAEEAPPTHPAPAETRPDRRARAETKRPWLWNVVLLDDDDHTYEYVIEMVRKVYGYTLERAFELAVHVDTRGRAVCCTTHRELAELRREQMVSFGRDVRMSQSRGAMSVVLEPAENDDD